MFADEPTGNLDSTTSGEILALLRDSVDTLGQTTVMVTHDAHAAAIADRVLFLADGDIVRDLGPLHRARDPRDARGSERPMIGVALKGLAGRKIRALLTAFAIVIGVSMVSGTFILTDTMQKSFNGLFDASYEKTDAVIQGKEIVKGSTNGSGVTVPASLLDEVRALPEVEAAGGIVAPQEVNGADIIGKDGKAVAKESIGTSYDAANARFSPLNLKTGDWPQGARAGRHRRRHRREGAATTPATPSSSPPPASSTATRSPAPRATARSTRSASAASRSGTSRPRRRCSTARAATTRISIAAKSGTSPAELVKAVQPLVPANARGPGQRQAGGGGRRGQLNDGMSMIRMFLLGFGGIALLVGAFVIFNTLSITVAQRTREFATLRTLGASRKQVMRSVRLEGLVIGLLASVIGLVRRPRDLQGHDRAVQRAGRRPARGVDGRRRADGHRLAPAGHGHHAAGEHPARPPRDPRPADRRRARGRDAPDDADGARTRTTPGSASRSRRSPRSRSASSPAA